MDQQRQLLVEKLKSANNILVTVSNNPSVDQLAAAIGLTLLLNKLKKHATAVFSGQVPSTLEFLKPEDTLEKNTDSLRDFIISLDKSKADKLRYKVEENVVKIFITPYRTSITQNDLNFGQGDFNVDVVVGLGVSAQQDLDQAIVAHGRILHDATVTTINTRTGGELGSINFVDPAASSLSELTTEVANELGKDLMDGQIATALLTGIVAETERFSNDKTSPDTMKLSAELMSAGANQQLVASSLQAPKVAAPEGEKRHPDGTLEVAHHTDDAPQDSGEKPEESLPDINVSEDGELTMPGEEKPPADEPKDEPKEDAPKPEDHEDEHKDDHDSISLLPPSQTQETHFMTEPPHVSGPVTATASMGSRIEDEDSNFDALLSDTTLPSDPEPQQLTSRKELRLEVPTEDEEPQKPAPAPAEDKPAELTIPEITLPPVMPSQIVDATPPPQDTLESIEKMLGSPHTSATDTPPPMAPPAPEPQPQPQPLSPAPTPGPTQDLDAARSAVLNAINSTPVTGAPLPPTASVGAGGYLNVQDLPEYDEASSPMSTLPPSAVSMPIPAPPLSPLIPSPVGSSPANTPLDMPLPSVMPAPGSSIPPAPPATGMPAPPPVPPPMTQLPPIQ